MANLERRSFRLPGMKGDEQVQSYNGDFFEIRLSRDPLPALSTACWLDGQLHEWYFGIQFDSQELNAIPGLSHARHLNELIPFLSITLETILVQLFTCSHEGPLADHFLYARIIDLLIELSQLAQLRNKEKFDVVMIQKAVRVKQLIDEDISTYLTVAQLAKKVWLSPSKLQQVFQYRYGMSVGKYSRTVRLQAAHDLLLASNDLLISIAIAVGFNDVGNFCTSFKSFFGYTPTELRNNKLKSQS